jgi:hypothetical protein
MAKKNSKLTSKKKYGIAIERYFGTLSYSSTYNSEG